MRKWWPLVAICLGNFILLIDVTIVNVALPRIADTLHADLGTVQWVLDGYAVALAALLLTAGSLADLHGRRRVYLAGLVLFTAASVACGCAPTTGLLIAGRVVQGVGGAAMFATSAALLTHAFRGRDRGVAFGVWGAVNGGAAALGPLLGGVITESVSWRWIFLVNVPIAVVGYAMVTRLITESHGNRGGRIDLPGGVTFTAGIAAVTGALIHGGDAGWTDRWTIVLCVVAALSLLAFGVLQARTPAPMLPLPLLRDRSFAGLMVGGLVLQGAAFAHLVFASLWLQHVLHLGPIAAGLAGSLPLSAVAFLTSGLVGRHMHAVAPQVPVAVGLLLVGVGVLLQATIDAGSGWPVLLPGLLVSGLGVGLAMPVLASAPLAVAAPRQAGVAGATANTFRQLGFALGVAVLGTVFGDRLTALAGAGPHAAYAGALSRIFMVAGVTALAAAAVVAATVRAPQVEHEPVLA